MFALAKKKFSGLMSTVVPVLLMPLVWAAVSVTVPVIPGSAVGAVVPVGDWPNEEMLPVPLAWELSEDT